MIFSSLLNDACPDSVWASPVNGVYSERSRTGVKFLFSFSAISAPRVLSVKSFFFISLHHYFIFSLLHSFPHSVLS